MKCLFLFHDAPLSPNYSGAASRYLDSFLTLSQLGVEVYVWRMLNVEERMKVLDFERSEPERTDEIRLHASRWQDVTYAWQLPLSRFDIFWKSVVKPLDISFRSNIPLKEALQHTIQMVRPDFIWAEHAQSASLIMACHPCLPWIYSHHDWLYKVRKVRRKLRNAPYYFSQRMLDFALKRAEITLAREATAVITGSMTEAAELEQLGAHHVQVIPTTYPSNSVDLEKKIDTNNVRIIHLGSLSTTANYQGLMAYLDRVHPRIVKSLEGKVELVIVGEAENAKPNLLDKLQAQNAILTGHVSNLDLVLSPYDIAIIPYELNTGTRTKLGLLFKHAQIVITTCQAVAGSEEAQHGKNCLMLPSLDDFPEAIISLTNSPQTRQALGRTAWMTYEDKFTLQSQAPKFEQVLSYLKINHLTPSSL